MHVRLLTCFSAMLLSGSAAVAAVAAESSNREIVVIGQSLKDTEKALADCIARSCPPDEEIRAALAHAENQFVTGEYRDAKSTLNKTASRNRKYGEKYPIEVSDLFRASSRIAEHLGEGKQFQLSVLDMRDTLKSALPADDARVMVAQIEVGDSRAKLGYPDEALRIYKDVEEKANNAKFPRVAAFARLRGLLLNYGRGEKGQYAAMTQKAREGLAEMARNPVAGAEDMSLVAEVALARIERKEGKGESTEAIIRRFAQSGGTDRPILLSAESIKLPENPRMDTDKSVGGNVLAYTAANFEDRWLDVGFWVNANGLVSDVEILRSEGNIDWAKLIADSIKSRIYAPLKASEKDSSPAFYMVERYTYTARYMDETTGTRIARRSPQPRIERIDITPENYDKPARPAG